nr:phosphoprotein [Orthoavulavirus sp.]UQT69582.1 phosphoprotein [Orthoavulavirus sp.]
MATFTEDEINELFETSGTVIESIITSQGRPIETVGKSAIPAGKTKALSVAWEKHVSGEKEGSNSKPAPPDPTSTTHAAPPPQTTQEPEQDQTQAEGPPGASDNLDNLKSGASSSLLHMLDKLGSKQVNAKKGTDSWRHTPQVATTQGGPPTAKRPMPALVEEKLPNNQDMTSGSQDTGENTAYAGPLQGSQQSAGAIPHVLQSTQNQGHTLAPATNVLLPADFVQAMMSTLEALSQRINKIDYQMDLVIKQTATLPTMRTEMQQVKTSIAVLEANIGMMKIMDPGNVNISSLSELRAAAKSHPVLLAGPGDPSPYVSSAGEIAVNKLSQPVSHPSELVKIPVHNTGDIQIEKDAVKSLVLSRPMHPSAANRLLARLESACSSEEIKKIKRLALNG